MSRKPSRHHVKPRSRFEPGEDVHTNNTVDWDDRFHNRWHSLFENMTVEEIHQFIDIISEPGTRWDRWKLKKLRERLKVASIDANHSER